MFSTNPIYAFRFVVHQYNKDIANFRAICWNRADVDADVSFHDALLRMDCIFCLMGLFSHSL